jgi:hypothetical protein
MSAPDDDPPPMPAAPIILAVAVAVAIGSDLAQGLQECRFPMLGATATVKALITAL